MLNKPFELQFLEVLDSRYELDSDGKYRIANNQSGYVGEDDYFQILTPLIPNEWKLLTDLTFELPYGRIQIDAILIAAEGLFHYEVKNFMANYEFNDGRWIRNGKEINRSPFTQLARANEIMRGLLRDLNIHAPIESHLVLINEEDTVKFYNQPPMNYLKRWDIKAHLKDIKQKSPAVIDPKKVADLLLSKSIPSHQGINVKGKELVPYAKTGILCEKCGSGRIDYAKRYHIHCRSCGGKEAKERAVLRTICDYGVLHYDQPLRRKEIVEFIGEESLESIIHRCTKQYLKKLPNGKSYEYINPAQQMEYAFKGIEFRYEGKR